MPLFTSVLSEHDGSQTRVDRIAGIGSRGADSIPVSICRALIRRDYADRARPCDDGDHLRDSIEMLFGVGTERAKHLTYGDSK